MACVVNVTRAFARGGLLELRLRADFVVTEAMVACASQGGVAAVLLLLDQGGRAALAGQPRGGRRAVAGFAWLRCGPEEVGRRALATALGFAKFARLPSVLHAASTKV